MATTIFDVLEEIRQNSTSERDKGDKFEKLMVSFFKNDPIYRDRFSTVWLWMDWPRRGNNPDTGIDLVAEEKDTGGYCAIQCKFYASDITLEKHHIDSFFTASGTSEFTSRLIVSTTSRWSKHAEDALKNQQIPVNRISLHELADSPIDWSKFSLKKLQAIALKEKKQLRDHQRKALNNVMAGFQNHDRGKLIMACGTGKTFTSLKIAESFAQDKPAYVLFLVPSISLLSQTLREWSAEAEVGLHSIAVCSDVKVGKKTQKTNDDSSDIETSDLPFPATTSPEVVASRVKAYTSNLNVIFSTYQSIQTISDAQKKGLPEFDLIICDEAHRTTGVTEQGQEASYFVRVHDQDFIKARKRLYMTATPRLYGDAAKTKAQENDIEICSMDDPELYGSEFHHLGFGEAVGNGLLTDYRVMVLAVGEKYVSASFQRQLADKDNELNLEDAVKITGCWNGLSKRMAIDEEGNALEGDNSPMRRAVAFSRSIKDSQRIVRLFSSIVEEYQRNHPDEDVLHCELDHVDGTQNSLQRNEKLNWLKEDTQSNTCRILSNARCLSEGVDVPALDAVMFLTPRNSVVDVVQSVGRVMRKAEGKKYGYIILPVGIPAGISPEEALKDNEKYKVIWQVLQALRAHDDRFNATVNKLELNQSRPPQIKVIGVGGGGDGGEKSSGGLTSTEDIQLSLQFPELEEWRDAIYAKIVQKCGDRRYWEDWAKDVAKIAEGHISRIKALLESADTTPRQAFAEFMAELHQDINPNVTEDDAIEMLSQHLITKPVFDALFEGYAFTEQNPVSLAMQKILDVLEGERLSKDTAKLEKFYRSVRDRAAGVDNAEGKQRIIVELYDKFFRGAFPRLTDRLGIVYTPVEVVDFIINSADQALKQEFGVGLTNEGVNILDPFTGTGTFLVRLLQSGLIQPEDLERKFKRELHANEIVLLAYYIAAINIEETYHGLQGVNYQPFPGIVLTDTFQMFENAGYEFQEMVEQVLPENNQRVVRQKQQEIRVIIGNPPYSAGQTSENDGNKNLKYPQLDGRIGETYAKYSTATNKNSLYDSYIRGIRWASDRIKDKGIVCYVTNGSFIDNNAMDGLRKCFVDEFSRIYCFNLRGNARTSGEQRRMEKGNVFGEGTRTNVAITLLIKNPEHTGVCKLFYHDIGDYLSREEKLKIIKDFGGIQGIEWETLTPNKNHDWINQRDPVFDKFISLGDKKDPSTPTIFEVYSSGVKTNRDAWCYNFSRDAVAANMGRMIDFYNQQVEAYQKIEGQKPSVENFVDTDSKKINWSRGLKSDLTKLRKYELQIESLVQGVYRPYCKQWVYFNKHWNDMVYQMPKIFPNENLENLAICVTGVGITRDFSALITNVIPNLHFQDTSQCFPLYTYTQKSDLGDLEKQFASANQDGYIRNENISKKALTYFQTIYKDSAITKEDIFYYVYGILHSPEYKTRFAADLKKMLPRIPYAGDFWAFSQAGRELAYWHLNYETIEPYPLDEVKELLFLDADDYRVEKMTFGKRNQDKSTIVYNSKLKLYGIPLEAYEYIVNGKSALDWVMERYKVTKDKDSGIVNDPNSWSDEPRYIVDLVKRVVRVSVETVRIVRSLPPLNEMN